VLAVQVNAVGAASIFVASDKRLSPEMKAMFTKYAPVASLQYGMNENDGHLTPVRKTARTISNPHVTLLASLGTLQRQCVCVCVCVCVWGGRVRAGLERLCSRTRAHMYTSTHVRAHRLRADALTRTACMHH
jgi:hypothetical protein